MGRNTIAIGIPARLHYFLFTVKVIPLKKSLLVIGKILMLFVDTLTVDEKHYLLTRDNLRQTIQLKFSEKQKLFLHFSYIFKIYIKFKTFAKKR